MSSKKLRVGIDVDGTLRNIDQQIVKMLEIDHPTKVTAFNSFPKEWNRLDIAFKQDRDAVLKWLYDERAFHIFAQAPKMYRDVVDHLNAVDRRARERGIELVISSVQRDQSITATLFWLSKMGCRVRHIQFYNSFEEKVEGDYDVVVDDRPMVLEAAKAAGKTAIVVPHPYNEHLKEEDGYRRLNYDGEKPTGIAGLVDLLDLDRFQLVEGDQ